MPELCSLALSSEGGMGFYSSNKIGLVAWLLICGDVSTREPLR